MQKTTRMVVTVKMAALKSFLPKKQKKIPTMMKMAPHRYEYLLRNSNRAFMSKLGHTWEDVIVVEKPKPVLSFKRPDVIGTETFESQMRPTVRVTPLAGFEYRRPKVVSPLSNGKSTVSIESRLEVEAATHRLSEPSLMIAAYDVKALLLLLLQLRLAA